MGHQTAQIPAEDGEDVHPGRRRRRRRRPFRKMLEALRQTDQWAGPPLRVGPLQVVREEQGVVGVVVGGEAPLMVGLVQGQVLRSRQRFHQLKKTSLGYWSSV